MNDIPATITFNSAVCRTNTRFYAKLNSTLTKYADNIGMRYARWFVRSDRVEFRRDDENGAKVSVNNQTSRGTASASISAIRLQGLVPPGRYAVELLDDGFDVLLNRLIWRKEDELQLREEHEDKLEDIGVSSEAAREWNENVYIPNRERVQRHLASERLRQRYCSSARGASGAVFCYEHPDIIRMVRGMV